MNRFLKDLMKNDFLFGNKVIILGGAYKQILPVVKHKASTASLNLCLFNSTLFPSFKLFNLVQNRRLMNDTTGYVDWVEKVGGGDTSVCASSASQPFRFLVPLSGNLLNNVVFSQVDLIKNVFGESFPYSSDTNQLIDLFKENILLAATNKAVNELNGLILSSLFNPNMPMGSLIAVNEVSKGPSDHQKLNYTPDNLANIDIEGFSDSVIL
ncbi:hypothetical protein BN7_578 [Wickerhamomyces ciferrii]|uniref:ATP-dependent DNA helicase n=1 Tax=Wickerhamomyces ciferrii (strain ATCC 14091 / BCRC 22168 / CBS 111 / JCM 3599 / NBRC 0793 / NRRL Y-1031 F-60-10) TaxID=1206466 RepID=K0KDP0_WICCF|nr:uncharacterized protein BN7_578 [Wickerhamomyces ciferrii]CCH41041.1 hypothetical protein BN7_578 [Wickerhamomyces ciferrii]